VGWGTHFCYFYETRQDLLDALVLFFKAGLENNEFCLWVVSQPLTVEEAKDALVKVVSDLDRHLAEGSLAILGTKNGISTKDSASLNGSSRAGARNSTRRWRKAMPE